MSKEFNMNFNALDDALKSMKQALNKSTKEELEARLTKQVEIPLGWISIEEHLPKVTVGDIISNGTTVKLIKVKDIDGNEYDSALSDHHIWYHFAKEKGITHWLNK